ncbi:MAG: 16S rRNA (uracil(1498)-N(3))-methyltransferase [Opitutales bacterium]|nr:16S rRNA (uracil(1498)-N(3))-methyltransferase [Opitutales bacterium]
MNRILFETQAESYRLASGDPRLAHARGVLRAKVGDVLDVGVVNGPAGKGKVVELNSDALTLSVEWGATPDTLPPIHLLVGMSRPQTMRRILQEAATLGVAALHIASASRSDPAYRQSRLWKDEQWRSYLIAGAEQAFDTRIPELHLHDDLNAALKSLPEPATRIALDVYAEAKAWSLFSEESPAVVLAIGPERGWTCPEQQWFKDQSFQSIRLSDRVLRVETAVVAALTLVQDRLGLLG